MNDFVEFCRQDGMGFIQKDRQQMSGFGMDDLVPVFMTQQRNGKECNDNASNKFDVLRYPKDC